MIRKLSRAGLVLGLSLGSFSADAFAGSASWAAPSFKVWTDTTAWSPATVPNGTADVATFSVTGSSYTALLNSDITLDSLFFNSPPGSLQHSGGTLTASSINIASGTYSFSNATIRNAIISVSGTGNFRIGGNTTNRFDSTTLQSDLFISHGGLTLRNGGTWTGGAATFNNADLALENGGTVFGKNVVMSGTTNFSVAGPTSTTFAADTAVRGTGILAGPTGSGLNHLVNLGTIGANVSTQILRLRPELLINNGVIEATAGGEMFVDAGSFTNNGTMIAFGGGTLRVLQPNAREWVNGSTGQIFAADATSTATLGGLWTNNGTINLNAGTVNLGGTLTTAAIGAINRTGGTMNITGTLRNFNANFTISPTTGDIRMAGGMIQGGSINTGGGATLLFNNGDNRFDGSCTLVGGLAMTNGKLRLLGFSTFTGSSVSLDNSTLSYELFGANNMSGKTVVMNNGTISMTSLTISNTSITGSGTLGILVSPSDFGSLSNNGSITANVAGQGFLVIPKTFNNNGTMTATNGGTITIAPTQSIGQVVRLRADGTGSVLRVEPPTAAPAYSVGLDSYARNGGMLRFAGTPSLNSGTIDASAFVVFDYTGGSTYAQRRTEIITGYAGGSWNGAGINSSAARVTPGTGVGYAESSDVIGGGGGTFGGAAVDDSAVLIRYTLLGDADLNGAVNINDFARLAAAFNQSGDWSRGDFNYDGQTNISDFALLASNFNRSMSLDLPRASIPEPTTIVATFVAAALLRRRREC